MRKPAIIPARPDAVGCIWSNNEIRISLTEAQLRKLLKIAGTRKAGDSIILHGCPVALNLESKSAVSYRAELHVQNSRSEE